MAIPNAKCSSLFAGALSPAERGSLKTAKLLKWGGSNLGLWDQKKLPVLWDCKMQFGVAPREESGIILQAQTPGLWDLLEASGRSSYQEAPCSPGIWRMKLTLAFFFFFFLLQHCSSKWYSLPLIQPPSFLYNSSVIRTHLIPCTVWYGRGVFMPQS